MPRALAINVGANTSLPGFRGPIYPDGSFTYVPIPERAPTAEAVPTYGDLAAELDLPFAVPADQRDRTVHLDPSFRGYPFCDADTYGDEHGVKAGPIGELAAGDYLLFYATLSAVGEPARDWVVPGWGAYLVGAIRLAADPVTTEDWAAMDAAARAPYRGNAHVRRRTFDASVLVRGTPGDSGLFDVAVPLSRPDAGAEANHVVTDLAGDSGRGPWWRRVLRFDEAATADLLALVDEPDDVLR